MARSSNFSRPASVSELQRRRVCSAHASPRDCSARFSARCLPFFVTLRSYAVFLAKSSAVFKTCGVNAKTISTLFRRCSFVLFGFHCRRNISRRHLQRGKLSGSADRIAHLDGKSQPAHAHLVNPLLAVITLGVLVVEFPRRRSG